MTFLLHFLADADDGVLPAAGIKKVATQL